MKRKAASSNREKDHAGEKKQGMTGKKGQFWLLGHREEYISPSDLM